MESGKTIAVTGVTGWLASHIVVQLLDANCIVHGSVRSLEKGEFLFGLHPLAKSNLKLVVSDLLNKDNWDELVKGCDVLIHTASPFNFSTNKSEDLIYPAVLGTKNVLQSCVRNHIKRVVLTSSVVAVTYGHSNKRYKCNLEFVEKEIKNWNDFTLNFNSFSIKCTDQYHLRTNKSIPEYFNNWKCMNEDDFSDIAKIKNYELSKSLAEQTAWKIANENNISLTVLCPGFIFGPILSPIHEKCESSQHLLKLLKHKYPVLPSIGCSHVDVRDAAECHVKAALLPVSIVSNKRIIVACDTGNINIIDQIKFINDKLLNTSSILPVKAPKWLISIASYFMSDAKYAIDKINKPSYTSNYSAYNILMKNEWRCVELSILSHIISLIKFNIINIATVPKNLIEAYTPYNDLNSVKDKVMTK
uniref:Tetraketide alpha-pyrone reductase 1-like n=1 Tax=Dermatophagoides pteronyssinus TaxID=6956 RepID=A0A6P6XMH1_DERPT|nr:tetraketide alpha-pyrone reductase 1-like [Dermatophagoides pteronyssinus]